MAKPKRASQLTAADRVFIEKVSPNNYALFASHYFDVSLIQWQEYFLSYPSKDKLVVAGIRSGKSFCAALGLLHFAFWFPHSRVLNVSITADQAGIIFNDIMNLASSMAFEHLVTKITLHPYPMMRLFNGSEIWSRSIGGPSGEAETLRGHEFDFINIDEAAYVVNKVAVDTLRGRLIGFNRYIQQPRYGLLTMTTTPRGGVGSWLFDRWQQGDPQYPSANTKKYLSLRARTFDNPNLDPDLIEEILSDYTPKQRDQELEGLFIPMDTLFAFEDLMAICGRAYGSNILDLAHYDSDVESIEKGIKAWLRAKGCAVDYVSESIEHYELDPQPNHVYVAGWDIGARVVLGGRGAGRNATVGVVYDITTKPWKLIAYQYDTSGKYSLNMERVKDWHDKYSLGGNAVCHTRIDSMGAGDVIHQSLEEDHYKVDGFRASTLTKGSMLQAASVVVERRWIRLPFLRSFIQQHQQYDPADDRHLAQDIVIASSQALHLARELDGRYSEDESRRRHRHRRESEVVRGAFRGAVRSTHRRRWSGTDGRRRR